jgi:hypothetical protein
VKTNLTQGLRGRAISPKAPRPQKRTVAEPNRPKICLYLGSPPAASGGPKTTFSDGLKITEPRNSTDHRSGLSLAVIRRNSYQVWWALDAFGLI